MRQNMDCLDSPFHESRHYLGMNFKKDKEIV